LLHIPVLQGENDRADRNLPVYTLTISGAQVRRTVPAGSEIEVLIAIDESQSVRTKAYVPILDEEFEAVLDNEAYGRLGRDPAQIEQQLEAEKKRLADARERAQRATAGTAQPAIEQVQRIDQERILHDAERAAASAKVDPDEAGRAEKRLIELRAAVDRVEDELEWPELVASAEKELEEERRILENPEFKATAEEKQQFAGLAAALERAIMGRDAEIVRSKRTELDRLGTRIVLRQPAWWVVQLRQLEAKIGQTTDPSQAQRYLDLGRRAVLNDDIDGLRSAVRQIINLLPAADPIRSKILSGVTQ
jgi:molecular chaperone DnaK